MRNFTAGRLRPASNDGSARTEPLQGDKTPAPHQIPSMENRTTRHAASRAEPISIHLERHRDCLERRHAERGLAGGRDDEPELAAFDRGGRPYAPLPFERRDDED